MEPEITPEPSPAERAAIQQALRHAAVASSGWLIERSPWWQAGLEEAIATPDLDGERPGDGERYSASSNGCSTSHGAKPW